MSVAPTFLQRLKLRNFRSIEDCRVTLRPLTLLVGPNGSGKSNFIDALRLVAESLRTSLEHALRERGGVGEVRRRSSGHPTHFAIDLDMQVAGVSAQYGFEVGAQKDGFRIARELCRVGPHHYEIRDGRHVRAPVPNAPPASVDRLYLVTASGLPEFRPLYDALSTMGFYSAQPERIRALQVPDQGEILSRDGSNLASVIRRMRRESPAALQRVEELLARVVPGVDGVDAKEIAHTMSLEFRQRVEGASHPWRFPAIAMSDGTLRATALLVALYQPRVRAEMIPLVALEEPETALHPAAAGVLFDALRGATSRTQVLVTTHSPDLLDHDGLSADEIRAVSAKEGRTSISGIDSESRRAMDEQLTTGGELMRQRLLAPEPSSEGRHPDFFQDWESRT